MDDERVLKIDFFNRRELRNPDVTYGADVSKVAGGAEHGLGAMGKSEKVTMRTTAAVACGLKRHQVLGRMRESAMSPRNILRVLEGKERKYCETGDGSVKNT